MGNYREASLKMSTDGTTKVCYEEKKKESNKSDLHHMGYSYKRVEHIFKPGKEDDAIKKLKEIVTSNGYEPGYEVDTVIEG